MSADEEGSQAAIAPGEDTSSGRRGRDAANVTTRSADPSSFAPRDALARSAPPVRDPERYEVICEHGRGGLGRVSRVRDKELGRDVAVKELLRRGPISELRFAREARITARLEHPGIVPVYEAGRWPDGTPFYAMKLVSGRPLRALIAERTTVDERLGLLHHVIAVADAMAYAHGRSIIHRDLKPANVIVGEFGETVVIDWGLAKDLSDAATIGGDGAIASTNHELTKAGSVLGTPAYMPPEQERGEAVDQRADVFAIGAMLWELCSLHKVPPSDRRQRHRLLRGAGIDDDLIVILDKAIDRDPGRRYADAGALAADLKAFKSGARITARSYSLPALLRHWTRRHRLLAIAAAAFIALLAGSVAGLAVLYRASSRNASVARSNAAVAQSRLVHSYVERGRRALVEGKHSEALAYLVEAAHRGDQSPAVRFMLARAAEPLSAEVLRLPKMAARAWTAAYSRDGQRILSADDGGARLWDAKTGRLLRAFPHPHAVCRAAFSSDERRIITFGWDVHVRIWDPTTGALLSIWKRPVSRTSTCATAALSSDGRLVAVSADDSDYVDVREIDSGALIAHLSNVGSGAADLQFSPDGRWFAATGGDRVHVFDTRSWTPAFTLAASHVRTLTFNPSGTRLATGGSGGEAALWEVPGGKLAHDLLHGEAAIERVTFSPDGQLVAAAQRGEGVDRVWQVESGALQSRLAPHRKATGWIAFDPSSKLVVAGGNGGRLQVSDALSGIPLFTVEGASDIVTEMHFDPSSRHVLGASLDGTVRIWELATVYRQWSTPDIGRDCGTSVSQERDRRVLAVSCSEHSTRVWDTGSDVLVAELAAGSRVPGPFSDPAAALASMGDRAAIARGAEVGVYELASRQRMKTVQHDAPVTAVRFAPEGRTLVTGDKAGGLRVTRDGVDVSLPSTVDPVDAIDFLSPDTVVVASARPELRIYDLARVAMVKTVPLAERARALRIAQDHRRAIVIPFTSSPVAPLLYDLERGALIAALSDHRRQVYSAQFVRGDREILTAGTDGTARFWDGQSGQLLRTLFASDGMLFDAALSPDGQLVVTAGGDGMLRFWDTASSSLLWQLRASPSYLNSVHFEGLSVVSRSFTGALARWSLPSVVDTPGWLARFDRLVACGPVRFDEATDGLVAQSLAACGASQR